MIILDDPGQKPHRVQDFSDRTKPSIIEGQTWAGSQAPDPGWFLLGWTCQALDGRAGTGAPVRD